MLRFASHLINTLFRIAFETVISYISKIITYSTFDVSLNHIWQLLSNTEEKAMFTELVCWSKWEWKHQEVWRWRCGRQSNGQSDQRPQISDVSCSILAVAKWYFNLCICRGPKNGAFLRSSSIYILYYVKSAILHNWQTHGVLKCYLLIIYSIKEITSLHTPSISLEISTYEQVNIHLSMPSVLWLEWQCSIAWSNCTL